MAELTAADLTRWEDSGARWRVLEMGEDAAVVELCTCYGEPVDVVDAREPALLERLRSQREGPDE